MLRVNIHRAALFGEKPYHWLDLAALDDSEFVYLSDILYFISAVYVYVCMCVCVLCLDSTFEALSHLSPAAWKKDIKVVFINEQGVEESGIDGGGLFIEFMDLLLKDMFSPPSVPSQPQGRVESTEKSSSSSSSSGEEETDNDNKEKHNKDYRELFLTTSTGLLVPNPPSLLVHSSSSSSAASSSTPTRSPQRTLQQYLFMGRLLAKAVYEVTTERLI